MAQDKVRRQTTAGLPGMIHDRAEADIVSRVNKNPMAAQVTTITVDTASNDTEYTFSVNGVEVAINSDADATKKEVRDALIAEVEDSPLITGDVVAEEGGSDDTLTLTSTYPGQGFDFAESDSNLSSTKTTPAAEADPLPFGVAVMDDGLALRQELEASNAGNYGDGAQKGKLLEATELTKQKLGVTVPFVTSAVYSFSVTVAGDAHEVSVVADTDQDTTVAAIVSALNDQLPANTVIASDDGGGSSTEVILEAELAGLPFSVGFGTSDEGSSNPDLTLSTDNREGNIVDATEALLGASAYTTKYPYPRDGNEGDSKIDPNSPFSVLRDGRIWVGAEDDPSQGSPVYVRLEANGSNDQPGAFRASPDTGCIKLPDASWVGQSKDADLLQLNT